MGLDMGRPLKYTSLLIDLMDDEVYSSASIVRLADQNGYFEDVMEADRSNFKKRVRLTLSRLATAREFPVFGDGHVILKGQAPTAGWYGWRWKYAVLHI